MSLRVSARKNRNVISSGVEKLTIEELISSLEEDSNKIRRATEKTIVRIKDEGLKFAQDTTKNLLPSGGGSYLESLKSRVLIDGESKRASVYTRHQWAWAVEYGTKEHKIEAKVGGLGSRAAKIYLEKIVRKPVKFLPEGRVKIKYMPVIYTPKTYGVWGYGMIEKGDPFKKSIHVATRPEWSGKRRETSMLMKQVIIAHEMVHASRDTFYEGVKKSIEDWSPINRETYSQANVDKYNAKKRLAKKRIEDYEEKYADKAENWAIQYLTKGKVNRSKDFGDTESGEQVPTYLRDKSLQKYARLHIQQKLSSKTEGAKYEKVEYFPTNVIHPGARAFGIMEKTQKFINENLDKWIKESLVE